MDVTRSWRSLVIALVGTLSLGAVALAQSPGASVPPGAESSAQPAVDLGRFAWFEVIGGDDRPESLCVGRYDGRVFEAQRAGPGSRLRAAGPVDGQILAWWRDGARSTLALVDTATGASRELLRTRRRITAAVFGPGTTFYYDTVDDRGAVLWKGDHGTQTVEPERVGRGTVVTRFALKASPDRSAVVIADRRGSDDRPDGTTFRVLDTATDIIRRVPGRAADLVGLLGDEVIVWDEHPMGWLSFPLRAIAPDGSDRLIVDQEGSFGAIVAAADGSPRLAFEGEDEAGRYTLSVVAAGPTALAEVRYAVDHGLSDPPIQLLWNDGIHGIESPGYVPLMPDSMAYQPRGEDLGSVPPSRLLVSLDGSGDIDLGVQPMGPTPDAGCWSPDGVPSAP